jgi:hypothetical protein
MGSGSLSAVVEAVMEESEESSKRAKVPKEQEIIFETVKVLSEEKRLIETQYGVLRVPDYIRFSTLSNIYYLVNSTNVKYVKTVLKNDIGALLLFPPVRRSHLEHPREERPPHLRVD